MSGMTLTLIAIAIVAAVMLTVRLWRRPASPSRHRRSRGPDPDEMQRADRLHRHATDYRASGALPRWDP